MRMMKWALLAVLGTLAIGCAEEFSEGDKPQVTFIVEQVEGNTSITLPVFTTQPLQPRNYPIEIRNIGSADAQILSMGFETTNPDGTPGNPNFTIQWPGVFTPDVGFPYLLKAGTGEFTPIVQYQVTCDRLTGTCPSGGTGTLRITTDDPEKSEYVVTFSPPECVQQPVLQPASITFFNAKPSGGIAAEGWCLNGAIVKIANQGSCNDNVEDVVMLAQSEGEPFKLSRENDWPNNELLRPEEPLRICVQYNPVEPGDSDTAQIAVTVTSQKNSPLVLNIKAEWESGGFQVSYQGQEKGYLDFTDVQADCGEKVVNIFNEGPSVLSIKSAKIIGDNEANAHYSMTCEVLGTGEIDLSKNPVAALAKDRTLECAVKYCAATLAGQNASVRFTYDNGETGTIDIPAFGGTPKSCFDYAPGDVTSVPPIDFVGEKKGEDIEGTFVIYNCGNAPLTVKGFRFEDAFGTGESSEYWTLQDAPAGEEQIGIGDLKAYTLLMNIPENDSSIEVKGVMYIDYVDPTGADAEFTGVNLSGYIDPGPIPTAKPALGFGASTIVGGVVTLNGDGSTPPEGGAALSNQGFVWYLIEKPAGSQVILNGPAGPPTAAFIPDVAGKYVVALRVFASESPFIYSDQATLEINVTEE